MNIEYYSETDPYHLNDIPVEKESVNHPSHYADGRKYEPIDVITDWELDFCLGNTVKYISRAGRKEPAKTIEDLEKAAWYLNYEIKMLKGETDENN